MTRAWVLAAPWLLSGGAGAFSTGLSPARRAVATTLAGRRGGMDAYEGTCQTRHILASLYLHNEYKIRMKAMLRSWIRS